MRRHYRMSALSILLVLAAGCNFPFAQAEPTPTPTLPPPTLPPSTDTPAPTLAPTSTPEEAEVPEEAILILEPGPGSRVVSPVRVAGISDSTFEQHLVVRLVLDDGTELSLEPTIIQAELGTRGPFEIDIPFSISGERQGFIQVYTTSARDGGITHLTSVGVILAASGPENIIPNNPHPERIHITSPTITQTI